MTKRLIDALYEDITDWTNNRPQNTVCPCLLINGHYRILSMYEFRAHYKNHTCEHYSIQFLKGNRIMFYIFLADNKLSKICFKTSTDFEDNVQLKFENDILHIVDCYNKFREYLLLYTVGDVYKYLHRYSTNIGGDKWSIPDFFQSLPNLSVLQKMLDEFNPNKKHGKIEKEIVIEI